MGCVGLRTKLRFSRTTWISITLLCATCTSCFVRSTKSTVVSVSSKRNPTLVRCISSESKSSILNQSLLSFRRSQHQVHQHLDHLLQVVILHLRLGRWLLLISHLHLNSCRDDILFSSSSKKLSRVYSISSFFIQAFVWASWGIGGENILWLAKFIYWVREREEGWFFGWMSEWLFNGNT